MMLDFLMNPSFHQSLTNNLAWLGPWLFMLLSLLKIALIAIGSLIISGLTLLAVATIYAGIRWSLRFTVRYILYPISAIIANSPASVRQPVQPDERPRLAA